jgi:electron transfer flavoprotein beta subunit
MNMLVCVKQVPDTTEIQIDAAAGTLIRSGVPSIVNPFDAYALEMAVRLKEEHGGTVAVLSMGPDQAKAAVEECLSVGADKGYLVSDRIFEGSDTLATSYILSTAIRKLGSFDIIFCGKQAIDGDTAQVGPEIAEHMDIPQVTCATELASAEGVVRVKRETDEGYEIVEVPTPTLITVTKTAFEPRCPTIRGKLAAGKAEIPVWAATDLNLDLSRAGLKGSPTKVQKIFTPRRGKKCRVIREETGTQSARALLELLGDAKIL